ncbi:MAG: cell division protein FtsZ [Saprospiraceae bacterium]|nr:cell division protein FtsZ [Saprospiraceae bacterium]
MEFDLPKEKSSIIKVFGIGGGGSNAVNYMYSLGISGVNYVICNTDNQALEMSSVPNKIQLGSTLREGLGAGSKPEVGKEATEEALEAIEDILQTNTKMVFITAGMGGGTGTGGAPVVARTAKDMGILTVGIVTMPFAFEGKKRRLQAEAGVEELRSEVDALLIISNDKLREIHGNLKVSEAFSKADDILTTASKGIAEIITLTGYMNVDFEDVNTVMRDSGVALMGIGLASGEERAKKAVELAMNSPLLNDNDIRGAKNVLLNISSGEDEISMDEMGEITDYIQDAIGIEPEKVIMGLSVDSTLNDKVSVTLIATGFESTKERKHRVEQNSRVIHTLETERNVETATETAQIQEDNTPFVMGDSPATEKPTAASNDQFTFSFTPMEDVVENNVDKCEKTVDNDFNLYTEPKAEVPEVHEDTVHSNAAPVSEPFQLETKDEDTEEYMRKHADRINRLKSFSLKFKGSQSISDLENEPAYLRKQVDLDDAPASDKNEISRYTLGGTEGGFEIGNNSYLHDNVD